MPNIKTTGSPHYISVDGFDELEGYLEGLKLSDEDEVLAVEMSMNILAREVEKNAPEDTGRLKKDKKIKVTRKLEGLTIGELKMGKFYAFFQEFGTSKSKKNVGFFSKSIKAGEREALNALTNQLLK